MADELPCGMQRSQPGSWLEWYCYNAGTSLVPPAYHLWCGINALAACIADRVYYEKFKGERLTPNLYVMLIGPSGVGKNQAIKRAQKRVEAIPSVDRVQVYRGKITAQQILSRLAKHKKYNYLWLVTPELAMQVGNGPKAEDFVTHMTELFDSDTTVQDDTRTSGHFKTENPCLNWTSGTTKEWLLRSVGKQDILGGFFARIFPIPGQRSSERIPKPIFPPDYDAVNRWLVEYLEALAWIEGPFEFDEAADDLHDWWVRNRREPTDELLWHFYTHGDNLLLKLAMVVTLADQLKMVCEYEHMENAIALYEWVYAHLPGVLEFAHHTPELERLNIIKEQIQRAAGAWVWHRDVLRVTSNRGVPLTIFNDVVKTLVERGEVSMAVEKGERWYRWHA